MDNNTDNVVAQLIVSNDEHGRRLLARLTELGHDVVSAAADSAAGRWVDDIGDRFLAYDTTATISTVIDLVTRECVRESGETKEDFRTRLMAKLSTCSVIKLAVGGPEGLLVNFAGG